VAPSAAKLCVVGKAVAQVETDVASLQSLLKHLHFKPGSAHVLRANNAQSI
jgi:hypothetical protein